MKIKFFDNYWKSVELKNDLCEMCVQHVVWRSNPVSAKTDTTIVSNRNLFTSIDDCSFNKVHWWWCNTRFYYLIMDIDTVLLSKKPFQLHWYINDNLIDLPWTIMGEGRVCFHYVYTHYSLDRNVVWLRDSTLIFVVILCLESKI